MDVKYETDKQIPDFRMSYENQKANFTTAVNAATAEAAVSYSL